MRKKIKSLFTVVALLATVVSSVAQTSSFSNRNQTSGTEPMAMSLADCQLYALNNNLTLANADLDLEIAQKKVWETASSGLPQISGSANYQRTLTEIPIIEFQPGIPIPLGVKDNYTAGVNLQQLIFSSSYIIGLKAVQVYKDISKLGMLKAEIEIRATVAQSYYLALMTRRMHELLNNNLLLLSNTIEQMTAMRDQGLVDRTQVDKLQVNYNLLWAQVQSTDRQIKNTEDMLKYIINMPIETPIFLTESYDNMLSAVQKNYPYDNPFVNTEHVDVMIAQNAIKASELQYKMAKLTILPTIGAQLGVNHIFNMPQLSFQRPTTATLGVALSMPIFKSGMIISQTKQARFAVDKAKNNEQQLRLGLDLQYEQAADEFVLAWDNLQVQRSNTQLAERVVGDTQKSVSQGMSTALDLIQVNQDYLEALRQQLNYEIMLLNAKVKIDKLTDQQPSQR